jgi:hypothetical protein
LGLSEDTVPDIGKVEEYQRESMACGNGFISRCSIRSRL